MEKMNLDVKRINELVKTYNIPIQYLASTFVEREQKWYDRAHIKDLENKVHCSLVLGREYIAVHTLDVMERWLQIYHKK